MNDSFSHRRWETLEEFNREQIRNRPPDFEENLQMFEALYKEAVTLGKFPPEDPLEGIEVDICYARAINV